ncbi:oligopeptide/dipeptide ABC transporter ATP-binding protein [Candidatus Chlorohelix sp.]|uniref:ABC transporter ATP-binding protein n=1 Tax=Candidatus Chlorohelix sp. TaxID=3139201 RepID=UPI00305E7F4F
MPVNIKVTPTTPEVLVRVENLSKHFYSHSAFFSKKSKPLKAVDRVSFVINKGETLGIVGESGCGKSTLGRLLLRLLEPTAGEIFFEETNVTRLSPDKLKALRKEMQMIFQNPYGSLNPWMTIKDLIAEPLLLHTSVKKHEVEEQVYELLQKVGLNQHNIRKYPHEFSGGQRQRICIARSLAVKPKFVVCDEPVSALDVSIQSQILNLLGDLQREFNLTYLFISHSFSVIRNIADRVAVMYLGKIVEISSVEDLFKNPSHPYTITLLSSIPPPNPDIKRKRLEVIGEIPSQSDLPTGCRYSTRCTYKIKICEQQEPELINTGNDHFVACHVQREDLHYTFFFDSCHQAY